MEQKIIVAYGKNREIGAENELLWQMPADMKHFRKTTAGASLVMGRKTWESIGRPLPGREMIVVTRGTNIETEGVLTARSIEEALGRASRELTFIIGGGEIYAQALKIPTVKEVIATEIEAEFPSADTFFAELGPEWKDVDYISLPADDKNPYDYNFVIYKR